MTFLGSLCPLQLWNCVVGFLILNELVSRPAQGSFEHSVVEFRSFALTPLWLKQRPNIIAINREFKVIIAWLSTKDKGVSNGDTVDFCQYGRS